MVLSGPTSFEPIFKYACEMSGSTFDFVFLLILTDGDLSSEQKDLRALIECSRHPVSISAIGIGNGPFDIMDNLDNTKNRRFDNFCFANYKEADADEPDSIACAAFQELIPQYDDYLQMRKNISSQK